MKNRNELDLETLLHIKSVFRLYSDSSSMCNGYSYICDAIKDLQNFKPNELKGVSNNEQNKKFCDCDADYTLDVAICSACGKDKK